MKHFFSILALFIIFPIIAKSQTGRITYDAVTNRSQIGTPEKEMFKDDLYSKAWLYFNGKTVLYQQLLPDSTITIRSGGGNIGYTRMRYPITVNDTIGSMYQIDYKSRIIKARVPLYNLKSFHIINDEVEPIRWSITQEKKNIGKFKVVKAEANYLGRKWTAWFALDIPVSVGPWKLYGLPGLILEAEDSSHKFKFALRDVQIPFIVSDDIFNPKVLEKKAMSKPEFVKFEKMKKDDQYRFNKARMEAAAGSNGGPVNIKINFAETIEKYK